MFSKVALFTTAFMAVFVAASDIDNSCNTGKVQCCNTLKDSSDFHVSELIAAVGISLEGITGQVGLNCSPLTVIGVGSGSSCSTQPVCCSENTHNGLVAVGCTPVNIGL